MPSDRRISLSLESPRRGKFPQPPSPLTPQGEESLGPSNLWQPNPHIPAQCSRNPTPWAAGPPTMADTSQAWELCSTALGSETLPPSRPKVGCQKPRQLSCFPTFFLLQVNLQMSITREKHAHGDTYFSTLLQLVVLASKNKFSFLDPFM